MNVIEFPNKRKEYEDKAERANIKNMVNFIIDNCEGDFCIVCKTKDIQHLFKSEIKEAFIVGITDIDKRQAGDEGYFFENFMSRTYFDLKT